MYFNLPDFSHNNDLEYDYSDQMTYPEFCPFRQNPQGRPPMPPPPLGNQGQKGGAPTSPPPSFKPTKSHQPVKHGPTPYAVEPGAIRPCLYTYIYMWLNNGRSFWAWLIYVGKKSASGWRWTGRRWVYFGIDLNRIDSFVCY